ASRDRPEPLESPPQRSRPPGFPGRWGFPHRRTLLLDGCLRVMAMERPGNGLRLLPGKIATRIYQEAVAAIIRAEAVLMRTHDFMNRLGRIDHRATDRVFFGVCHRCLRGRSGSRKKPFSMIL